MCDKIFKPKTCGFYKCEYQCIGLKIEDGDARRYYTNPKETRDSEFEYFSLKENEKTQWPELHIYVLPIQEIKYKPK